ncbi:MAG: rhodanese-like domain-containing protein [Ignavibacteria bacterium]|nr:rhodanese-like domain-containing protein [Ignavibacteria bacterium]
MIQFIKNLLGAGVKVNYRELYESGATIIDVRSKGEFQGGHIKGSVNIPLDILPEKLSQINKSKPIITCCASGMRSSSARRILLSNGFTEVHNGGGWQSLLVKMRE